MKWVKGLNPNEAATHTYITPVLLRQSAEVTANTLQLLSINAISNSKFLENLKLADATPVFKTKDALDKTEFWNFRIKSSYEIELRKMASHFELLIQKYF